jgi:O-antigen/teichoic acid export membrane protein
MYWLAVSALHRKEIVHDSRPVDACLAVYGMEFESAHLTAVLLASSYCIWMVCRVVGTPALQVSGKRMTVVILNAFWAVVGVATMVVAGSQWGEAGIAVGHLVGFVGVTVTTMVLVRRMFRPTSVTASTVDD